MNWQFIRYPFYMNTTPTQNKNNEIYKAIVEASKNGELWGINKKRRPTKLA